MKIDYHFPHSVSLADGADAFREAEASGYAGIWNGENTSDPFLPLGAAALATSQAQLGTGVALAFVRSPAATAYVAHDLQVGSNGRFVLGLGSQVRAQIVRRYGMQWSRPAARMREYILAVKAIWRCWNEGANLDFDGEFFKLDLMQPYYSPKPSPSGPPPIWLGAFGERMTETAGEVAEGLMLHPLVTPEFVNEVVRPTVERGLARRETPLTHEFEISGPVFVATGRDENELHAATEALRERIAFYGSTPAYRAVLDFHGWGEVHEKWRSMAREGEWSAMGALVTDEILHSFGVVGEPGKIPALLLERARGMVDRLSVMSPYEGDLQTLEQVMKAVIVPE